MYKEPLMIGNVEVTEINEETKTITLLVHVSASPSKMYSPEVENMVAKNVFCTVSYLIKEGFLPSEEEIQTEWKAHVAGVCHPV